MAPVRLAAPELLADFRPNCWPFLRHDGGDLPFDPALEAPATPSPVEAVGD